MYVGPFDLTRLWAALRRAIANDEARAETLYGVRMSKRELRKWGLL